MIRSTSNVARSRTAGGKTRGWRLLAILCVAVVGGVFATGHLRTSTPVIASGIASGTDAGDSLVDRAVHLLRQSLTANDRVVYTGDLVTTIYSKAHQLDFEVTFSVVNDPAASDYTGPQRELRGLPVVDGVTVSEDDARIEIVEQQRSFRAPASVDGGDPPPTPFDSGINGLTEGPPLYNLQFFRIADSALFASNYEVIEQSAEFLIGNRVLVLRIVPTKADLPEYLVKLDEATGLILHSEMRFRNRHDLRAVHTFRSLDIDMDGSIPATSEALPPVRLPGTDDFELSIEDAAELVPGFRLPNAGDLPSGFRIAGLRKREMGNTAAAIEVRLSNGLESYFMLVRQAAFKAPDPVATALPRLAAEMGLESVDAETRDRILETRRPHLERLFRVIEETEDGARGERDTTHVAWKRTQMGITKFTVYSAEIDMLVVGPLSDEDLLRTAETQLTK